MSFILDALKKSENARQRQIGPAVAELPRRRPQSDRPVWAFVVAGLLLVNIGVLALVLTRGNKGPVQPAAAAVTAPNDAGGTAQLPLNYPAALPARQPMQLPPEEPLPAPLQAAPRAGGGPGSLAEEAALPNELDGDGGIAAAADLAQAQLAQGVRPIQAPAVAPLANAPPAPAGAAAAQPAARSDPEEVLPSMGELQARGRSFPPLKLDIHTFADKPADRFVFVNMRRYNEGQTLAEGMSVERITEEGVILNQQGMRFLLPRN